MGHPAFWRRHRPSPARECSAVGASTTPREPEGDGRHLRRLRLGRDRSGLASKQLGRPRDMGRNQGEAGDGAAEVRPPAAAAPPRCRGGSADEVGIGDRPRPGLARRPTLRRAHARRTPRRQADGPMSKQVAPLRQVQEPGRVPGPSRRRRRRESTAGVGPPLIRKAEPAPPHLPLCRHPVRTRVVAGAPTRPIPRTRPPHRGIHAPIIRPGSVGGKGCPGPMRHRQDRGSLKRSTGQIVVATAIGPLKDQSAGGRVVRQATHPCPASSGLGLAPSFERRWTWGREGFEAYPAVSDEQRRATRQVRST